MDQADCLKHNSGFESEQDLLVRQICIQSTVFFIQCNRTDLKFATDFSNNLKFCVKGLIFWMVVYFIKLFKVIISSKTFIHPIYFLFEEPNTFHSTHLSKTVICCAYNLQKYREISMNVCVCVCVCVYYNTVLQVCLISSAVKTDNKRQLNEHNLVFPNIFLHSVI